MANEEKLYDERQQSHKDFAMIADNYTEGEIVPRLISTVLGDVYTTNAFGMTQGKNSPLNSATTTKDFDVAGITLDDSKVNQLAVDKTTGYLVLADNENADANGPIFEVAKIYTMADGQPGVKIIRVK